MDRETQIRLDDRGALRALGVGGEDGSARTGGTGERHLIHDVPADQPLRALLQRELLAGPAQLLAWCRVAELPAPVELITAAHVDQARELREAIHRLARARVDGRTPSAADIGLVNSAAQAAGPPTPALAPDGLTALPATRAPLAAIFSFIARDTIDLFTGPYALRIRECVAPDCSLFFVDRSRPGSRRWCAMAACGEKASSATYRQRHPGHR